MQRTDKYEGMIAETTVVRGYRGDYVNAYFARPTGGGGHPSMVLFHHRPGWDEWYREATRRFAHHGFAAICPDLYSRFPAGTPDDVAAQVRASGDVTDAQVVADGTACIDLLRALPYTSDKVGLFGTCSGARHAFLTACQSSADAIINCWGGRLVMRREELNETYPIAPIDLTPSLPCPMLGLFGNDDRSPSPADVDRLETELTLHNKVYQFYRYDGAGHGFFYYDRPAAYRAEQAVDGWKRIWEFTDQVLQPAR